MNRPDPPATLEIPLTEEDLDINPEPPILEEMKAAIKAMKRGKAAGVDRVTADMLKAEETETPELLTRILRDISESESAPKDWKIGLIMKLVKKGDLSDCNTWRGITLLSITSKVLSKIIHSRLIIALDNHVREEHAGFRAGRSCLGHIFRLR